MGGTQLEIGAILFHKRFEFFDGELGEKLIVLLNEPETPEEIEEGYIFARTTSQEKSRFREPECQPDRSEFFIAANNDWFLNDTWVQLYELYTFDVKTVIEDSLTGVLEVKGRLKENKTGQLINCVNKATDVSGLHKRIINTSYKHYLTRKKA